MFNEYSYWHTNFFPKIGLSRKGSIFYTSTCKSLFHWYVQSFQCFSFQRTLVLLMSQSHKIWRYLHLSLNLSKKITNLLQWLIIMSLIVTQTSSLIKSIAFCRLTWWCFMQCVTHFGCDYTISSNLRDKKSHAKIPCPRKLCLHSHSANWWPLGWLNPRMIYMRRSPLSQRGHSWCFYLL